MPRAGLDGARVVDEAARIADAHGLGEVTLARVAKALGVRAPSLYNHVEGLPGLLRLLTIRSLGEQAELLRDAAIGRAGPDALRSMGRAYRSFAVEHPGRYASTVPARWPESDDEEFAAAALRGLEVVVAVLGAWGFAQEEALHHVRVVRSALHGFVTIEATGGFRMALDLDHSFELLLDTLVAGLGQPG